MHKRSSGNSKYGGAHQDEDGSPVQAKSRIVVLGNLERHVWENKDKYAPVIGQASTKLLVSLAVKKGRTLKQGDCKNTFCHSVLPEHYMGSPEVPVFGLGPSRLCSEEWD